MNTWSVLLDVGLLLGAALLLGMLFERLRQSAVVGYLAAGILLGPGGFQWVENVAEVRILAELGVALLLFTIGLEFSWRRLKELGNLALFGGILQVSLTAAVVGLGAFWYGLPAVEAMVIGAATSVSSTAVVLRVLADRSELDSLRGRNSLGILLLQDLAVVPLVLLVTALGEGGGSRAAAMKFAASLGQVAALVIALFLLSKYVFPRILHMASAYRNRDLPVVVATTVAIGAAAVSHALGLSEILGAFLAGMLLAHSPFAEQIRADVIPLRAAFLTLFFTAVGMIAQLPLDSTLLNVALVVLGLMTVKALIVTTVVRLFRRPVSSAFATGLCLAQLGEFSFVLVELARRLDLVRAETFQVFMSASVISLVFTPYLIAATPWLEDLASRLSQPRAPRTGGSAPPPEPSRPPDASRVIIVGYGPAGRQVAKSLQAREVPFVVVDLNPRTVAELQSVIPIEFGDAARPEILHHLKVEFARAVVVTTPDPHTSGLIIRQVKRIAPVLPVIARARYHVHASLLAEAGADHVIDEEALVGDRLGTEILEACEGSLASGES